MNIISISKELNMLNTDFKTKTYTKPLKEYHNRYYKILSIIRYFQNNAIKYNQTTILNALNIFLSKDGLKKITLRTLRKDLTFLCNKDIIKKTLLRLGEGNGSYIRYTITKYSITNLKKVLKAKEKIIEHDVNKIFIFTKETRFKYFNNVKAKIFKSKNVTKNVSHNITININYNKYAKNEIKENETINKTNSLIKKISKWKTMRYLDKIKENANKKEYENNMSKVEKWLKSLEIKNNTTKN